MPDPTDVAQNGAILGPGSHPAEPDYAAARGTVALNRQLDGVDRDDVQAGTVALRTALGNEYAPALRLARSHFASLPAEQREELRQRRLPNGTLALNDPQTLFALGMQALGPLPRDRAGIDSEIEKHEGHMRIDRRGWMKDERSQIRLRQLYRFRDEGK